MHFASLCGMQLKVKAWLLIVISRDMVIPGFSGQI